MFDYYAMPNNWPGRDEAAQRPWAERARFIEDRILADVTAKMGARFDTARYFIPYIQLHEFEALAFADIDALVSVLSPLSDQPAAALVATLARILDDAGHPEAINNGYETCPSRRIEGVARAYKKRVHGPIIAGRIGLATLRARCGHFGSWVDRLEGLG